MNITSTLYRPKPKQLELLMQLPFCEKLNEKQKPHSYWVAITTKKQRAKPNDKNLKSLEPRQFNFISLLFILKWLQKARIYIWKKEWIWIWIFCFPITCDSQGKSLLPSKNITEQRCYSYHKMKKWPSFVAPKLVWHENEQFVEKRIFSNLGYCLSSCLIGSHRTKVNCFDA